jgi:hypothetical protein
VRPLLIPLALAACDLPASETLDPSAVVTGIYSMTASTQSDTCNPPRFVGAATLPVFADASTIGIFDESSPATTPTYARYDLLESAGYAAAIPPAGATIPPCPTGGSFSLDFTLAQASATALEVTDDETWTIVSSCPTTIIDAATVPYASCAAGRTLEYTLVEACAPPCTIISENGIASSLCSCPVGSGSASAIDAGVSP